MRLALARGNMWLGKIKDVRAGARKPIPGWPPGYPWYGAAAVLHSVTKVKSYQWNLQKEPTPGDLVL